MSYDNRDIVGGANFLSSLIGSNDENPYSEKNLRARICDPFNKWSDFFRRILKKNNTLFQNCEQIVSDLARLKGSNKITDEQMEFLLNKKDLQKESVDAFQKKIFGTDSIEVTESLKKIYPELSVFNIGYQLPGGNYPPPNWTVEGFEGSDDKKKIDIWKNNRDLYRQTLAKMKEPQLEKLIETLKLNVRALLDSTDDPNSAAFSVLMTSSRLKQIIQENFDRNQNSKNDLGYIPCGDSGVPDLDCIVNESELDVLLNDNDVINAKENRKVGDIPEFTTNNLEIALNKWWWSPNSTISEVEKTNIENQIANLQAGNLIPYHKDLRLGLKLLVKESKIKKQIIIEKFKKESEEKRKQIREEKYEDQQRQNQLDAQSQNLEFTSKNWRGKEVVDTKAKERAMKERNAFELEKLRIESSRQQDVETQKAIDESTKELNSKIDNEFKDLRENIVLNMEQKIEKMIDQKLQEKMNYSSSLISPSYSPPNPVFQGTGGGKSRKKKKSRSISVKPQTKRKKRTKKRTRRNKKNRSSKNNSSK